MQPTKATTLKKLEHPGLYKTNKVMCSAASKFSPNVWKTSEATADKMTAKAVGKKLKLSLQGEELIWACCHDHAAVLFGEFSISFLFYGSL